MVITLPEIDSAKTSTKLRKNENITFEVYPSAIMSNISSSETAVDKICDCHRLNKSKKQNNNQDMNITEKRNLRNHLQFAMDSLYQKNNTM